MKLTEEEWQEILRQVRNDEITELDLCDKEISDEMMKGLAKAFKINTSLTSLDLGSNNIGDIGAWALAEALKENSRLAFLDLENNKIGEVGARSLAEALKENNSLTSLGLVHNNIGDGGASWLAEALKRNSSLTTLELIYNNIEKEGARSLGDALRQNSKLTFLNLNGNKIGEAGTRALAEALKENSSLTLLSLVNTNIGARGGSMLAKTLKENATLTSLCLENNYIGKAVACTLAETLQENSTLIDLDLAGNVIAEEGLSALAEAMKENKTLSFYLGPQVGEFGKLVNKNKDDNQNLAKLINSKINSYLEALGGESIDASSELNLEDLKQRGTALNYILQNDKEYNINPISEAILFFNIAFKELQKSESYNSTSELFEAAMTELAMQLNEGYYQHSRDYPALYVQTRLGNGDTYKISDEVKQKLLWVPAVKFYKAAMGASEQGNHAEALNNLEQALVKAPGEPRIMLEKAKVLYTLDYKQQADEEFEKALNTSITTPDKFIEIRNWFTNRGEFNKTIALQEKLITDTGDNNSKYAKELKQFKEVIELNDGNLNHLEGANSQIASWDAGESNELLGENPEN